MRQLPTALAKKSANSGAFGAPEVACAISNSASAVARSTCSDEPWVGAKASARSASTSSAATTPAGWSTPPNASRRLAQDRLLDLAHSKGGERRRHADRVPDQRLQHLEFGVAGEPAAFAQARDQPIGDEIRDVAFGIDLMDENIGRDIRKQVGECGIGALGPTFRDQRLHVGERRIATPINRPAKAERILSHRRRHDELPLAGAALDG